MQQSSANPTLLGVAEDCCMLSLLLAVPSCIYSFWHGVIPTSYFIFNDFCTCYYMLLPHVYPMASGQQNRPSIAPLGVSCLQYRSF